MGISCLKSPPCLRTHCNVVSSMVSLWKLLCVNQTNNSMNVEYFICQIQLVYSITDCAIVNIFFSVLLISVSWRTVEDNLVKACQQKHNPFKTLCLVHQLYVNTYVQVYNCYKGSFQLCVCSFLAVSFILLWWSTLHYHYDPCSYCGCHPHGC